MSHAPEKPQVLSVEATPEQQAQPARCALATGSASWGRKYKKSWRELGFYERAAIIREQKERRESPEDRAISAALREARHAREQREAKLTKLRAYLLAKRTKPSSPNAAHQPRRGE